jgi:FlaA1/EpsC-like NDP-sugar epimerase
MLSLLALPRVQKSLLLMLVDMLVLPLALLSAFCLRYSDIELASHISDHSWLFVWVLLVGPLLFLKLGLYRAVVRYIGWDALWSIVLAVVLLSFTLYPVSWLTNDVHMPLSVPLIFAVVATWIWVARRE